MYIGTKGTHFCDRGKIMTHNGVKWVCPRHDKTKPKERSKIGRYSGVSKRIKGGYEKD